MEAKSRTPSLMTVAIGVACVVFAGGSIAEPSDRTPRADIADAEFITFACTPEGAAPMARQTLSLDVLLSADFSTLTVVEELPSGRFLISELSARTGASRGGYSNGRRSFWTAEQIAGQNGAQAQARYVREDGGDAYACIRAD